MLGHDHGLELQTTVAGGLDDALSMFGLDLLRERSITRVARVVPSAECFW